MLLAYLHVQDGWGCGPNSVFIQFEMEVGTKLVRCLQCSAPSDAMSVGLRSHFDRICKELRGNSIDDAEESLFSVASRLLQLLNNDLPSSTSPTLCHS